MKRLLIILMVSALVLGGCGGKEEKQNEKENEKIVVAELTENKASFADFTVEIKKAEVEDDELILETLYTNDSNPEPTSMLMAGRVFVRQNGEGLEELTGVIDDPKSNYRYKNETGIWCPIDYRYKLKDVKNDVEVVFTSNGRLIEEEEQVLILKLKQN